MRVRKLREYLESVVNSHPPTDQDVAKTVNALFIGLRRHDRDSVKKALGMFFLSNAEPAAPSSDSRRDVAAESAAVTELRQAFEDDVAFRSVLDRLKASRTLSREGLNRVYCELFGKARTISTKVTKAKVAQDIADLRLERVRSKKAAQFFAAE